jgi:hypothetical protein
MKSCWVIGLILNLVKLSNQLGHAFRLIKGITLVLKMQIPILWSLSINKPLFVL